MKFTKYGKALLVSALSAGLILGVTSCVESYTVGFLYVTGTVTAQSSNNGIVSGFKIDHNTGFLTAIHGLPVASGGSNPVRAVLITGQRFMYVLNRGVNAQGGSTCTTTDPCQNSNITQFAVGGNGILTPQETFYTQGINPFRLIVDTTGNYLLALDHDAPDSDAYTGSSATTNSCTEALGSSTTSCADITVFKIDSTTGRLSVVTNAQVSSASGQPLTYFPVPANPIDFLLSPGFILTLSGTPATGDAVFPYTYVSSSGQLTLNQNSAQPLGIKQATAIVSAGGTIYVLDNEPVTIPSGSSFTAGSYPSQILPFTVGTNGALQAETGGIIPDDSTLANPIYITEESKGKFLYVANQGNNTLGQNANSGIAGYFLTTAPNYQLTFIAGEPFGSGAGPQCLVEDPSDQFIYTANYNDSTVTGRIVDPNSGVLNPMKKQSSFTLDGQPTWCLTDGRTD
jgi:Lactonase, 7-bladed beta-propeller